MELIMADDPSAEDVVIKTLVRHIAGDPKGAISELQGALDGARTMEREEIILWIDTLMPAQFEDVHEVLAVLPGAIAAMQHKEGGR